jgi:hypothetical protein
MVTQKQLRIKIIKLDQEKSKLELQITNLANQLDDSRESKWTRITVDRRRIGD